MKINISAAATALVICFCLSGTMLSGKDDEFREVTAFNSKLPIYHKNRLQFVVSCKTMQRQAEKINATDAVIDIIRKGANIDRIQYLNVLVPYPLGAPLPTVVDFWKDRLYSEAIISSSSAQIDQENKTANGTEKVYLRSPALDLNGIGFLANYDKHTVLVRKDVNIVVRLAVAQTRNLTAKTLKQAKDDVVRITSETLFVDFDKNLITLQGKVRINEARFSIDSDEVQLLLSGNEDNNKKNVASDEESQIQGVSKVTCIGNVVITKTVGADELQKAGEQKATAGKAVYEVKEGQIVLTENRPQIKRGNDTVSGSKITIWKETERMLVEKDGKIVVTVPRKDKKTGKPEANKTPTIVFADFMDINYGKNIATLTGNVKVDDTMLKLDCHKMTIYLEDAKNQGKKTEPAVDAKNIADDGLDFNRIAKS
ncbi:MAG: LptA/OstA family protein, partial [Victivallaceae bacterium]